MPEAMPLQARYHAVELQQRDGWAFLRFEVENASDAEWLPEHRISASYQIFDPETEILLVEGERELFVSRLGVGAREAFDLALRVPREPGRYRVYGSLMQEGLAWAYEQGWTFILADLLVSGSGEISAMSLRLTDRAALERARSLRRLWMAFVLPFATIWRNRGLSATLVRREILSRSKGSFGGSFWPVLSPLLLMLTYFFVFGLVLRSRFEDDPSPVSFALYLLAGMIPWLAFSEAAGRAPLVLFEYRQLIKKVVFPIETLPVNLAYSGLVGEAFGLVLFTVGLWVIRGHLPATILLLPLLLIPQILFTIGVSWAMAITGAYFRDLSQVNGFLLTIWFFLTPICYPDRQLAQLPRSVQTLLRLNPLYILVTAYRAIFLQARAPDWRALGWLTVCAVALFLVSHAVFYKLRKSFADVL